MTTFRDSIADDMKNILDNVEAISVVLNRNTPETLSIATANRGPMNRRLQAYSNVQLEDDDITFVFQANQFSPNHNPPEIRHKDHVIDESGLIYIVQVARLTVMQTIWSVVVRRKTP